MDYNKGINLRGFPQYREICDINPPLYATPHPDVKKESMSEKDALLNEIFRVNPKTGLPEGDLAVFLNDNTSPEIKQFIQQNLMNDMGVPADASGLQDVDDDTILELTRKNNESSVSYSTRVFDYLKSIRKSESRKKEENP